MHSSMAKLTKKLRCCSQCMDLTAREICAVNMESIIARVADCVT